MLHQNIIKYLSLLRKQILIHRWEHTAVARANKTGIHNIVLAVLLCR